MTLDSIRNSCDVLSTKLAFECLGWCTLNFKWCIWIQDGLSCILDGLFGIVDSEGYIVDDISL